MQVIECIHKNTDRAQPNDSIIDRNSINRGESEPALFLALLRIIPIKEGMAFFVSRHVTMQRHRPLFLQWIIDRMQALLVIDKANSRRFVFLCKSQLDLAFFVWLFIESLLQIAFNHSQPAFAATMIMNGRSDQRRPN